MWPCRLISDVDVADDFRTALGAAGARLELDVTWLFAGSYHFRLGQGFTIALTPESAGRVRIEACRWTRSLNRVWALLEDTDRIGAIVGEMRDQVTQGLESEGVL